MIPYSFQQYYELLDNAQPIDEGDWHAVVAAFIHNFVVKDSRNRWRHLCLEKPQKAKGKSHKIYGDLNWERSSPCNAENMSLLTRRANKGIFYDFSGSAWWLSPHDALRAGHGRDAIFCLDQGTLALFCFHELEDSIFRQPDR